MDVDISKLLREGPDDVREEYFLKRKPFLFQFVADIKKFNDERDVKLKPFDYMLDPMYGMPYDDPRRKPIIAKWLKTTKEIRKTLDEKRTAILEAYDLTLNRIAKEVLQLCL